MSDLSIEQAARLRATTDPRVVSALESIRLVLNASDNIEKLQAEQIKMLWEAIEEMGDQIHTLSTALVRAGIPLIDPPTLRGVS